MRKYIEIASLLLLVSGMCTTGCGPVPRPLAPSALPATVNAKPNLELATTIGNGTWIPVNKLYLKVQKSDTLDASGRWLPTNPAYADMPLKLLALIDEFERAHPELEVYEHRVEWQPETREMASCCFGVYLFHRPRRGQ